MASQKTLLDNKATGLLIVTQLPDDSGNQRIEFIQTPLLKGSIEFQKKGNILTGRLTIKSGNEDVFSGVNVKNTSTGAYDASKSMVYSFEEEEIITFEDMVNYIQPFVADPVGV